MLRSWFSILGRRPSRKPQPTRRKQTRRYVLVLENLESRDVPAPLTWAGGINLPLAGGIAAVPEGTSLLTLVSLPEIPVILAA